MSFVYKVYSGYDGFYPKAIPNRIFDGKYLRLGWKRYLDEVQKGDEVWIYFNGPHRFENGIYVKGRIHSIDLTAKQEVLLRVYNSNTSRPLTSAAVSLRIARVVAARGRQVFFLPTNWETISVCSALSTGQSCGQRQCEWCPYWQSFHRIQEGEVSYPLRFPDQIESFTPALWAIPPRCYLKRASIAPHVHETSQLLRAFKAGNGNLAYPFAKAIFETFHQRGAPFDFDALVPIPLSPDKIASKEIHRTKLLADELGKLSSVPVVELFQLNTPISKRRLLSRGYTYAQFQQRYKNALEVSNAVEGLKTILLIDDVSTHGGTIKAACEALWERNKNLAISVATATQMIVKKAVRDEGAIRSADC